MSDIATLRKKFQNHDATVGIIGLGYVGLPLALTFIKAGFKVTGFDIDSEKVKILREGRSYIRHIPHERIVLALQTKKFGATADFSELSQCNAVLICVPTPLNRNREPDMSFIEGTAKAIGPHLQKNQLIVLESTTYPGTTDELLKGILESISGLQAGSDFFLAFSPEREDPGNIDFSTQGIPKVVGGHTATCGELAAALYGAALDKVISVSSTKVAEMTKLLENIFRSVNIALVNELKILCERMGIDIWEVIRAASTKPFGYMPFYPGPGLGGHCIPIDPFYLTWKAREYEFSTRFIELAGEINASMPHYVVERTGEALNHIGKPFRGANILILGIAYKKNVDDMRESPALRIIELFEERGAHVSYHDPYVPKMPPMRKYQLSHESQPLSDEFLKSIDVAVVVTDHNDVDYRAVLQKVPMVVDTRNVTRDLRQFAHKIIHA